MSKSANADIRNSKGASAEDLDRVLSEILALYFDDQRPWVIGYSGGKDSTAVLRLVIEALLKAKADGRPVNKPVFVVSSDTLVETPSVVDLIGKTLTQVCTFCLEQGLPVSYQVVTPAAKETFWVNLIGKGYPAPTRQFRWCTDRMKIEPVSEFIRKQVAAFGEVIVVLGSRSAESSSRAQVIKKHKLEGTRLARHQTLPNAFVYTPVEAWSADDVWEYLFSGQAPWGDDHRELFALYKDSNAGECPLVIDKTTPSCGNSRFGCWVCTVVTQDRAIDGLIESGKTWLQPLKDFRNELFDSTRPENKTKYRSAKGRLGQIKVFFDEAGNAKASPGPYKMEYRQHFLRKLLEIQRELIRRPESGGLELISLHELEQIRVEWRRDPVEPQWDDPVPTIYHDVFGDGGLASGPSWQQPDDGTFSGDEVGLLAELSPAHQIPKELPMKLLELEISMEGLARRANLIGQINGILSEDWGDKSGIVVNKAATHVHEDLRDREIAEYQALYAKWAAKENAS
jgi:DNA sulfur modification protein DndC